MRPAKQPSSSMALPVGKFPTAKRTASQKLQQARWRRYVERHRDDINRRRRDRRRMFTAAVPCGGATFIEVAIHTGLGLGEVVTLQTDALCKVKERLRLSDEEIYQLAIARWIRVARVLSDEGLHAEAAEIMVLVREFSDLLWAESAGAYLNEVAPADSLGPTTPAHTCDNGHCDGDFGESVEPPEEGLESVEFKG